MPSSPVRNSWLRQPGRYSAAQLKPSLLKLYTPGQRRLIGAALFFGMLPGLCITFPFHPMSGLRGMQRIAGIDHHRNLVGAWR